MTGGPRSAADFHVAGLRLLGERGRDGLTIAALCKRLRVTKGSFYHHFGSMPAYVEQLFAFWEADQAARLAALPRAEGYPTERLESLVDAALDLPHDVEAAIRAWGGIDASVAAVQVRVDRRRERRVADTLVALGLDREQARHFARLAISTLIGAQLRDEAADWRRMRNLLDELARLMLRDIPRARAAARRR